VNLGLSASVVYTLRWRCFITIPVSVFIIFPLCLIKKMSGFRFLSIFGMLGILYTLIILLVQLPSYMQAHFSWDRLVYFDFNANTLSGMSITFFAYTCQINLLPVY